MSHTQTPRMSTASSNRSTANHQRCASMPSGQQQQSWYNEASTDTNGHERTQSLHSSRHASSRHRRHHHHRRSSTRVQPDIIDQLDNIGGDLYHHEGPYDAACRERNSLQKQSPIAALKLTNEEALKATPRESVMDSVTKRRPLDNVAYYPPGSTDRNGQTYNYEEGYNMMTEDRGNFRRWPGMKFRDEDFKKDPYYQRLQADLAADAGKRRSWSLRRPKRSS